MTPKEEEDYVYPNDLKERWALRDELYRRRRVHGLTEAEKAAVRMWRIEEAKDHEDDGLLEVAKSWPGP